MQIKEQSRVRRTCGRLAIAVVALSASATMPVAAEAKDSREFSYFLPRTALKVEISQLLNSCGAADGKLDIDTTITVTPVREADTDKLVRLDVGSGFLAKRTVKLALNPDGTLASFNSESEGQAAPVLAAVAKFGLKIATAAFWAADPGGEGQGTNPPPAPKCNDDTRDALDGIAALKKTIADLETRIGTGKAGAAQTALLSDLRQRLSRKKEAVILTKSLAIPFAPSDGNLATNIEGPSLADWFDNEIAGSFQLKVFPAAKTAFAGDGTVLDAAPMPNVIYRKGVPGVVLLVARKDSACLDKSDPGAAIDCVAATDEGVVTRAVFPQLSGLYAIRAGKGGLFGSRQAGVTFDANGVPSGLEYGTSGGSADLASAVDAASDGADTLRDAQLSNLERAIAIEEARAKLAKLRAGEDAD